MCYTRVGMSDNAERGVYYPQIYGHKSHMTGEEYSDSYGDVDSDHLDPFVNGRDGLVRIWRIWVRKHNPIQLITHSITLSWKDLLYPTVLA